MFESGESVAAALEAAGATLEAEQRQPNGVDLTAGAVLRQTGPGRIGRDGKRVGDRSEVETDDGTYRLDAGTYVVRYGEPVRIPEGHVGFVLPRSTLLRNSCTLDTAVWDAGYEGVGEGRLDVGHRIEIEPGARIAQLVLARADHEGTYDGDYQSEGI
ncbi:dUTP pyrophosphatase [Halorubrum aquaticum]|uniref:dUTP pyrophosphatase n=1 Tax=Halorubrum aquaticum TaxID=387340 RepID=A0A1I3AQN2_9EURY|nr:deoxyuridine 5'-triphosphate nucleotidohydrolase [Halorubrum aquaticum]SFH52302.1 dUTP pyrophosphatase [Halorubrum aquaticum]